ncbi:MAG: helix-turn-helix transcriptional regulator [Parvibaculum sp.]|uniref:helix-turn-helix transcriptional regulator n=1 Tax=Parvibaculum sp. TaxID=2024848 RepID=UPI002AB8C6D2|nr:helix-turn-helix transcriptional regulator [Parvibaculum sp.]MDZ4380180.1 helix-turn-helix transcriptional regulator [Parvibaculum sp.]
MNGFAMKKAAPETPRLEGSPKGTPKGTGETAGAPPDARHSELGHFLRARRERLTPQALGLPEGRRRRTAGLRREEVAERAGISTDWYIRLEQGRTVSPSPTTVDALARALDLDKAEHAHLKALASRADRRRFAPEEVPETVKRMVESLAQPAYVTGRRWDVLHWNEAADRVFAFSRIAPERRNILLNMLTNAATRRLFGDAWEREAKRMVAEFRKTHDLWAGDPAFAALLARLAAECTEFDTWWKAHDIRDVAAGRKELSHPKLGSLRFDYASFQANDDPGLKLVVYTPV